MVVAGMPARDIGVQALNLVGQPQVLKKLERPVNRRGLGAAFAVQIFHQIIGFCRFFGFNKKPEHFSPDPRHPLPVRLGDLLCNRQKSVRVFRAAGRVCTGIMGHGANVGVFAMFVKGRLGHRLHSLWRQNARSHLFRDHHDRL